MRMSCEQTSCTLFSSYISWYFYIYVDIMLSVLNYGEKWPSSYSVHVLNLSDINTKIRTEFMFVTADIKSSIHIMHVRMCVLVYLPTRFDVPGSTGFSPYEISRPWFGGLSPYEIWGAWFHWFISVRNLKCLVPLVYLRKKFEVPGSTGLSPYEIWSGWLHWFIAVRILKCLVPVVYLRTKFEVPGSIGLSS